MVLLCVWIFETEYVCESCFIVLWEICLTCVMCCELEIDVFCSVPIFMSTHFFPNSILEFHFESEIFMQKQSSECFWIQNLLSGQQNDLCIYIYVCVWWYPLLFFSTYRFIPPNLQNKIDKFSLQKPFAFKQNIFYDDSYWESYVLNLFLLFQSF